LNYCFPKVGRLKFNFFLESISGAPWIVAQKINVLLRLRDAKKRERESEI
jgi:hypothetical protein